MKGTRKTKVFNRFVAVVLSLTMLLVFPIVSFADVFAGSADATGSTQVEQTDSTADGTGDTGSDQTADSTTPTEKDQTTSGGSSDASSDSGNTDSTKNTVSYPRQTFEETVNGTKVNVVAPEGALPEGTTMEVKAVKSSDVKDAVEKAATGDIKDMQALDISFHKGGKEIEPKTEVTVQFSGMDMNGDSIEVFHMKDKTSAADKVGESKSTTNASVQSKDFSIYVLTTTESGVTEETLSTSGSGSKSKVLKIGDTMRLKEYRPTDYLSGGTWSTTDSSVAGITTDASDSQIITIEAKKMGAAVISYTYTSTEKVKKSNDHVVKSEDYYVTVKSDDNRYQVCFYILLPGKSTPADSSAQPAANYYPASGSQYYTLTGTVSETVYNYIKDGNSYYDADGIDTSLYEMDDTTSTNIASYLTKTYGEKHDKGIVWYTLKQESDRCPHIDGFVSNADTTVTYHSNFGTDVTKKYDAVTGTKYTVLDYKAVGETAAEKLPTRSGYTFAGWSTTKGSTKVDYKADDTFQVKNATDLYAVWTSSSTYTATYKFVAQDGSALPVGVTSQCPSIETGYADGETVTVPDKTYTPVAAVEGGLTTGTWSFVSWDQKSQKINGENVTFTGTWTYTAATKYGVTYEYKSSDGASLPTAISTTTGDYKVKDDTQYYAGATVNRVATPKDGATYEVKDGDVTTGTWTLKWDKGSDIMTSNGVKFVGTWTYTAATKYGVTYEYKSSDGASLPTAISTTTGDYKVKDDTQYYAGATVNRVATPKDGATYEVKDGDVTTGTWTLKWDKGSDIMTSNGVKFVGTWTYTAATKYGVTYEYKSSDGASLPTAISTTTGDYKVKDDTKYYAGATVNRVATPKDGATYEVKDGDVTTGTWTLKWDKGSDIMTSNGVKFVGTWTYEAATKYAPTYKFESGTDNMTLPTEVDQYLPNDTSTYLNGESVTPKDPTAKTYNVDANNDGIIEGTWTFKSWDSSSKTMTNGKAEFIGKWTYEKAFHVNYKFVSSDGSELPDSVKNLIPSDNADYYANDTATVKTSSFRTVYALSDDNQRIKGQWTFVSWDNTSGTFSDSDITFTGTWKYVDLDIPYNVVYKDIDDPSGADLAPLEEGNGKDGDVVNETYLRNINLIKGVSGYDFVRVEPVTLYGPLMPRMLSLTRSMEVSDNVYEVPTATVYYKKVVTPPASSKYILTINYVDEEGNTLATSYSDSLDSGAAYSQDSPAISGYKLVDSTQATVAGTMPEENVTVNVVYTSTAVTPNNPNNPKTPTTPTPASDKSASTGDSWNGGMWLILLLLGAAGVTGTAVLRRKESEED